MIKNFTLLLFLFSLFCNAHTRVLVRHETNLWTGDNTINSIYNSEPNFKIVPNPAKSYTNVFINELSTEASLKIYDVLGKVILSKIIYPSDLNNSAYKLDLSNYNKGVYLLSITVDSKQKSFKLIKL